MSNKTKTAATTNEAVTPALVPKLRFPEFRGAGGWEQKEVGEVFQVTRGDVLSMTLVQDEKSDAMPYPVYSSQTKNNGLSGYYSDYLFEDAITWTTDGANAGDVNYRTGKFFCTNVCGVLLNSKGFANPCIAALINRVSTKYVSYVGNPKLMNGVMSKIPIPVPSLAEQQKIAECLSSVDELISAQARKLDALKTHKKGLMQQLFPREGETQPRLRFPEFQNTGEWESRKLKDLLDTVIDNRGKTPPLSIDGYPLIEVNALGTHKIDYKKVSKFVDEKTHKDWFRGHVQNGDVLFSTVGAVAESSVVCAEYRPVIAQNIVGLRFNKTTLHQFGFHLLTALQNKAKFLRITMGAVQPSLKVSQMVQISFRIPSTLPEQQRIADCLTRLDDLIAAQTQTLEALKTHKKGLMQQLFLAGTGSEN